MAALKKRTNNFSSDEKRILTELVLKYQNVVENKRTDATTNSTKLQGWIRLAEEFNTISSFCHRTHTVLKCCWENIKRQTKKDRADKKKKLFMTGGGKPPTPPPSNTESTIVEAILGPALKGIPSDFDTDSATFSEIIEVNTTDQNEKVHVIEGDSDYADILKEDNENIAKSLLKEKNDSDNDTWNSWTPKNLKTPVSSNLKVSRQSEESYLKRRRPKINCLSDELVKEKIKLIKILQENAEKEAQIRLAILKEQLKQEEIKTQKVMNS
ncbi:uncharacterized protein LOC123657907 [Melitaea cinxia]|uniref:uncharacterized protein LOC123657907 n=2 Tax=Melitaea cinxia TaxID=113334 RepID=UPI001E274BBF|nr:uncharacterized protein LOC123657907 [Melitaea cinxia]